MVLEREAVKIAVISPHADDAIFSCAEHMLSRPEHEFTIITPFMGIPEGEPHRSKYITLTQEHFAACTAGGWGIINGPFFDDAVPEKQPVPYALDAWLDLWLRNDDFEMVWVPWGIHHPDHLQVVRSLAPTIPQVVYEELPYFDLYPAPRGAEAGMVPLTYDPMMTGRKRELCRMYASQVDEQLEQHLYHPERIWTLP